MNTLLKKTANGVTWTSLSSIVRNVVSLIQITVLARILTVSDFGIIAIANVFLAFTQIFVDLGISVGILHKQNISKNEYSSLYWLNIFTGILLTMILIIISPLISSLYKEQSLSNIIMLLSLNIFFSSIGSQHRIIQSKEMRFKSISLVDITVSIISLVIAVMLALDGFGVYSLVYASLSSAFLSSIIYLFIGLKVDKNIKMHFNLKETYPFLKIGSFQLGSAVMDYFSREIDIIFIGSAFGKETVGLYSLCKKIVMIIYATVNPIFTNVITPLLAKLQSGKEYLQNIYLKIVESLSIINFPIYILVSIFSFGIITILYGEQYNNGSFILSILAINYGLLSASNPIGSLQVALGRTDIGFYWTIYRIISTSIIVYIGSLFNVEVLVTFLLVLTLINTIIMWRMQIFVMIKISAKHYFEKIFIPFLISLSIAIPMYLIFKNTTSLISIIIISSAYLISYSVIVYLSLKNAYIVKVASDIFNTFRHKFFS